MKSCNERKTASLAKAAAQILAVAKEVLRILPVGLISLLTAQSIAHAAAPCPSDGRDWRHIPSPDWRDQIIYFAMADRFDDGDSANNDQRANEFKPGQAESFNGGDLKGLMRRLDYVQGLGATALWITPPVANQWTSPDGHITGYHGYWARHFKEVDAHLGTLDDYRALAAALHCRSMYLVQDIVVNHTGDYFSYGPQWKQNDPASGYKGHVNTAPSVRPTQPPFDLNDPTREADRKAAIYHWTPDVSDYRDPRQKFTYQMSGLDDLNTENPRVRSALRESYAYWIREVGVDAYRVDTAFYVPQDFYADFLYSKDRAHPGIDRVARETGRNEFLVFGEGFGIDARGKNDVARQIESYMHSKGGKPRMNGMLNFPLYGALNNVIARGKPPSELGERIASMMKLHPRAHWMPTFLDNHDVDRFLAAGSTAALKQGLLALMTLPGIPVIYYGTEQGFNVQRAAMFKHGYHSGGFDRFDTGSELYRHIQSVSGLRRANRTLSRGTPRILYSNDAQPGALVWEMRHGSERLLVALNTAGHDTFAAIATGLPAGTRLTPLYAIDGDAPALQVDETGLMGLTLTPRGGWVWKVEPKASVIVRRAPSHSVTVDPVRVDGRAGVAQATGRAAPHAEVRVVRDGDLARAQTVLTGADGRWRATLDTSSLIDPDQRHDVVAMTADHAETGKAVSNTVSFKSRPAWIAALDYIDPAGDDHGPRGTYGYPQDPTWGTHKQMDLRRVRAWHAAGSLKIELKMHRLTQFWQPANGFDHAAITLFIALPGREGGAAVMPMQNAELPMGMRWHYRLRAHGWSNALYSDAGASATVEGTPVTPGARIEADKKNHTLTFTLPADALGRPRSLKGAKLYVTTWDYDGGYRALQPEPTRYAISGGDGRTDPLLMDDTPILELK
jgi:glycosidase